MPAAFEEAPEAPEALDNIAPASFEEASEAPDDVAIATLEIAPEAAGDVAVSVGRRASLVTLPDRIASSSSAITVEFAVVFNQDNHILRKLWTELRGLR